MSPGYTVTEKVVVNGSAVESDDIGAPQVFALMAGLLLCVALISLVVGISVNDTTMGTTLGNLGYEEVRFPKPVFHGDTIRVTSEVIAARLSKSRTDSGIVTFRHTATNQRGEQVCIAIRNGLMLLRPTQEA